MTEVIRMLLVDDHALFRKGLIGLIGSQKDLEVVGEAEDGDEALEKARQLMPDVILMDISMAKCDGLEATRLILDEMPYVRIVILTVSEDEESLYQAIKSGAMGYLLKDLEPDLLYGADKKRSGWPGGHFASHGRQDPQGVRPRQSDV
jgi:DNA-binding NarL/FixJ family response regulator